ncbi:MAG: 3-isopropylmalate dehydratase small subunit [Coriobacteriales bacterium]|jgi:3-isopropylmalate/(R)-2-methylmalate dehydratase small subunit|nr:3-isopropylmalate dehydratase small subunit [Coriobacteriales bacterium]
MSNNLEKQLKFDNKAEFNSKHKVEHDAKSADDGTCSNDFGYVLKYGNNVDTDVIIPARYLNTTDKQELASHCMEDLDKDFVNRVRKGDIIVAGENFGCGSSREHAPIVIKESGIALVVAISFARIFYRNAINIGLPIVECADVVRDAKDGDKISFSLADGTITNLSINKAYRITPFSSFVQEIMAAGGLAKLATSTGLKTLASAGDS